MLVYKWQVYYKDKDKYFFRVMFWCAKADNEPQWHKHNMIEAGTTAIFTFTHLIIWSEWMVWFFWNIFNDLAEVQVRNLSSLWIICWETSPASRPALHGVGPGPGTPGELQTPDITLDLICKIMKSPIEARLHQKMGWPPTRTHTYFL